jgi:hypothetical protein
MICVGQKSRQLWLKSAAGAPLRRKMRYEDIAWAMRSTKTVEMCEPYEDVDSNQQLSIPVAAWGQ